MHTKRYEFLLDAAQPIAHHEATYGNHAHIQRRKVRLPTGSFADVPVVTADTMRHGMREAATYALLDAAGLLAAESLSQAALRLLFSGGMVTGRGDAGTVNLDQYRELVELVPPLGLFGGCAGNRLIPGRLFVDDALLACSETRQWWPEWVGQALSEQEIADSRAYVEEVQRVRMDPLLSPEKRKLLAADAQVDANKQLAASEAAHDDDDALARDDAKSSMMPRTFERVIQGSLFNWSVTAHCYSDLDVDTLLTTIGAFLSRAVVGGKKGTGHGFMRCMAARDVHIARPSERAEVVNPAALGPRVGELFRTHVAERKERLAAFLKTVNA